MRREDWVAMANASIVLAQVLREDGQDEPGRKFRGRSSINPLEAATAGIEFARLVQALQRRRDFTPPDMAQAIRRAEDGVAHTSATPPFALLTPIQIYATLALCAVVGATTNSRPQETEQ
jgi:hypothetical protein